MQAQGVDALLLLGQQNVAYATGVRVPAADQGRALHRRPVALRHRRRRGAVRVDVVSRTASPTTSTPATCTAASTSSGTTARARSRRRSPTATSPSTSTRCRCYLAAREAGRPFADASGVLGAAKICKTADELECLRRAQAINEAAMVDVHAMLAPGLQGDRPHRHVLRAHLRAGHLVEHGRPDLAGDAAVDRRRPVHRDRRRRLPDRDDAADRSSAAT